jgi:predicted dehydrogenase
MDKARELLSGRTIGMITGYTLVGLPATPWWRVKQKSGGQMVEQSTHIFDLVRYLAGEAKAVYCSGAKKLCTDIPGCDVEDVTVATLTLASGTIATVLSTCGLVAGGQFSVDVIARGLRVQWDYGTERLIVHGPKATEEFQERTDMFVEEIESFLHAIRTGDRSRIRSTFSDAVKSLELSLSAEESMASGRVVSVAD